MTQTDPWAEAGQEGYVADDGVSKQNMLDPTISGAGLIGVIWDNGRELVHSKKNLEIISVAITTKTEEPNKAFKRRKILKPFKERIK